MSEKMREALKHLYALVQGECPSLLENDHHDEMVREALAEQPAPPISNFGLAALGVKHFGNPIPKAWYSAARELLAEQTAQGDAIASLAAIVHYPDHWDTAVYPDALSAIREALFSVGCSECKQAAPPAPSEQPAQGEEWRHVIVDVMADISDHSSLAYEKLRALLQAAPPAPSVPDGWKLVPERLPEAMERVGEATLDRDGTLKEMWANMLAVAPEPHS